MIKSHNQPRKNIKQLIRWLRVTVNQGKIIDLKSLNSYKWPKGSIILKIKSLVYIRI